MDITQLFKTGHTADESQIYRPATVFLDQSDLSRSNMILNQTIHPPSVMPQQIITTPTLSPRIISQPLPPRILGNIPYPIPPPFIQQIPQPTVIRGPIIQSRPEDQILVYCPVCRRDYPAQSAQIHAQIHNLSNRYKFTPVDNKILDRTNDSIAEISPSQSIPRIQYPLIQPLEFWTNQLSDSTKNDVFILRQNRNYDEVDPKYFNSPQQILVTAVTAAGLTNIASQSLQRVPSSLLKPPLQYQSNDTNVYNCFDNLFNGNKGPKFSAADMAKNNKIITPKRRLEEYIIQKKNNPRGLSVNRKSNQVQPLNIPSRNLSANKNYYTTFNL